jgi:hypothetical protein
MGYQIEIITGENHDRRGVAFLLSGDKKINAHDFFSKLTKNDLRKRQLNVRFDCWRDRQPDRKHRYHGWNRSEFKGFYTHCFVFKFERNRIYGFLCNPKSNNKAYQLCVLVRHALKNESETDETELKIVNEISSNLTVQRTVKDFFKEKL